MGVWGIAKIELRIKVQFCIYILEYLNGWKLMIYFKKLEKNNKLISKEKYIIEMNAIEKSTKSEYDSLKSDKINRPIERWTKRCNEQIAKKGLSILKQEEKESANNPISTCKIKSIIIVFLLCCLLTHTYTNIYIHKHIISSVRWCYQ